MIRSLYLTVLGRWLIASLFILGGINKIINFSQTISSMSEVGLEPASVLLPLTILLEIGGGLIIAIGLRWQALAALALAIFTVATNIYFHNFWVYEGPERAYELSLFFKNVVVVGALVFFAGSTLGESKNS